MEVEEEEDGREERKKRDIFRRDSRVSMNEDVYFLEGQQSGREENLMDGGGEGEMEYVGESERGEDEGEKGVTVTNWRMWIQGQEWRWDEGKRVGKRR